MPQLSPRLNPRNCTEIYERRQAGCGSLPSNQGSKVPQICEKSARRIQNSSLALFVLLCGGALWMSLKGNTNTPDMVAPPRELHEPLTEECIDGLTADEKKDRDAITLLTVRSSQLTTIDCPGGTDFKSICLKKEYRWWIILYILGILYMFAGLAIVCDEFFVPALECFVDHCGISMDVAGATFMAAGGSMPELFTSFIATFNDSNVGFAAIVGSAVFNVLFVIAVCAIASKEVLVLTYWPLVRDCTFYLIALFTVVGVFVNSEPAEITWWEATILLMLYGVYCTFMKFNSRIQEWVEKKRRKSDKVSPEEGESTPKDEHQASFAKPSVFRKGIVGILTSGTDVYQAAGVHAVTALRGNLEESFKQLDKDGDGMITCEEIQSFLESCGLTGGSDVVKTAVRRIARSADGKLTYEAFRKWYLASEARIEIEVRRVFDSLDKDGNGTIERVEIKQLLQTLGHQDITEEVVDETCTQLLSYDVDDDEEETESQPEIQPEGVSNSGRTRQDEKEEPETESRPEVQHEGGKNHGHRDSGGVHVTFNQFNAWYSKSLFWDSHHENNAKELEEDENEPLELAPDWAKMGKKEIFWFCFTYPLCAMMYCTLPDVRRHENSRFKSYQFKLCIVEFCLSLVWIGIFSNCLYEWIVVVSDTIGIPAEVSAVTVLAGGTSIPDLLSSYIVARKGEGDMAVSSSIGSNIFDVTVGLPLPWLCYNIFNNRSVKVGANNLKFSIIVLILMLIAVVVTVMVMNWKMTKSMGYIMMILYFVFVAQDLLQQLPKNNPVLKISW